MPAAILDHSGMAKSPFEEKTRVFPP
jgi:hypothetical protein